MKLILFRPPRQLRFTRLGTSVVLLTLGIGLAAMNTGNNLVYMIFGMMLGFITASGVISEMSLRKCEFDWIFPNEFYAKTPSILRLILRNKKKRIPSFGIEVFYTLTSSSNSKSELQSLFLFLPGQSHRTSDVTFVPPSRGKFKLDKIKMETQFPFGFFKKSMEVFTPGEFIVYPEIYDIQKNDLEILFPENKTNSPLKGLGDSFWGMKEFIAGDNPRQISWKSSAKQSRLMVKETEKEVDLTVTFTLYSVEEWKQLSKEELEYALSFAASLLQQKLKEGFSVGFNAPNFYRSPSSSQINVALILGYLALFDPTKIFLEESSPRRFFHSPPIPLLPLWEKYKRIKKVR